MNHSHQEVVFADKAHARLRGCYESATILGVRLGSHGYTLRSSFRGLGCRRGNYENAAGCKVTVWLLDGHGVNNAAWLYCHATRFDFGYRNTSWHGNGPG